MGRPTVRWKPANDAPVLSSATEMGLGDSRVIVVQRIGDVIRITTGHRVKRSQTSSLVLGGTVLLPLKHLPEVFQEVMAAAQDEE